jgi:hypothetical protein
MEIGEDGKLRKRKPKAADDEIPNERDDPNKQRSPANPDREDPSGAWNAIPVNAKVFALAVVNAGRARRGVAPLTRLAQDETVLPADGVVPRDDPGAFAKCCINAARKARGQKPLKSGEFISIRELRGAR